MKFILTFLTALLLAASLHATDDTLSVLPAGLTDGPKSLMLHRYLLTHANEALNRQIKGKSKSKVSGFFVV
jgi:hypothetical protein